jgi:hypothetical protein
MVIGYGGRRARESSTTEARMNRLSRDERLVVLELVTEVARAAAQNPNVVWMVEFQEQLVEALFRKMAALVEEPKAHSVDCDAVGDDDDAVAEGRRSEKSLKRRKATPDPR